MFRVLGFWAFAIGLLFLAGDFVWPSVIFFAQALVFYVLGAMKLTERTYMYLFGAYMFLAFCGMVYYANFISEMPA